MRFVALLVAAIIAIVAGVAALKLSGNSASNQSAMTQPAQPVNVAASEVLVAREAIPLGAIIEPGMIDKQPWPSHLLLDGFIIAGSDSANLTGKVARAPFQAGEPIMSNKIANPNDPSFLAASLPPGMRAVTVATDAVSGVAGYVFPGDRVDVIITHNIVWESKARTDKTVRAGNKPDISEVLVPDVRVLAVNVRQFSGKDLTNATPSTVTIAVQEADVQAIRLGEKVGTLSLALRSLKDDEGERPHPINSLYLTQMKSVGIAESGVRIVRGAGQDADTRSNLEKPLSPPVLEDAAPALSSEGRN